MQTQPPRAIPLVLGILGLALLSICGPVRAVAGELVHSGGLVGEAKASAGSLSVSAVKSPQSAQTFPVPPPALTDGIFPCSGCHAGMEPNATRRELADEHTDILLNHDEEQRWCLDCHTPADRDTLHLISGERIGFTESYRLCGQCHGDKYRDWRIGLHGKRTGYWNGDKEYLLCTHCHNPHDPKFKPLRPLPPSERSDRRSD